mmetsp:Transcript_12624/g.33998  ORF Transcript_12624/g.33998 Transcript_12624/m.33998 type:complete len:359 (+) Transcript_12624:93-1169(+)
MVADGKSPVACSEDRLGHRKFASYSVPDWVQHPQKLVPLKAAILFPGEQSSFSGMFHNMRKTPVVLGMLRAAAASLGFDVEEAMEDRGGSSGADQALAYVADCILFEAFREAHADVAERCQAVAGFGVGEYAALYAAGVITFQQGLEIVKVRSAALQDAGNQVHVEAIVVRGMALDKLERLMKAAQKLDAEDGVHDPQVAIAQYWCPGGYVCVGTGSTVQKLHDAAVGDKDAEVRLLPDQHAGHTSLAKGAGAKVAAVIERLLPAMKPPRCELFLNQSGRRVPPGKPPQAFADALMSHLSEPIQWESCVTQMMSWGIRQFYECGPNRSIRFMMRHYEHIIEAPFEILRPADFTESFSA